jgi:hypothetical protein
MMLWQRGIEIRDFEMRETDGRRAGGLNIGQVE